MRGTALGARQREQVALAAQSLTVAVQDLQDAVKGRPPRSQSAGTVLLCLCQPLSLLFVSYSAASLVAFQAAGADRDEQRQQETELLRKRAADGDAERQRLLREIAALRGQLSDRENVRLRSFFLFSCSLLIAGTPCIYRSSGCVILSERWLRRC